MYEFLRRAQLRRQKYIVFARRDSHSSYGYYLLSLVIVTSRHIRATDSANASSHTPTFEEQSRIVSLEYQTIPRILVNLYYDISMHFKEMASFFLSAVRIRRSSIRLPHDIKVVSVMRNIRVTLLRIIALS